MSKELLFKSGIELKKLIKNKEISPVELTKLSLERIEETEWFNIVAWNRTAETCSQYLSKGQKVYIEGRLSTRSWEDQSTGQKKYRTELVADQVKFLSPPDSQSQQNFASENSEQAEDAVSPPPEIDPDDLPF